MKIHRFVHVFSALALAAIVTSAGFALTDTPAEPAVAAPVEQGMEPQTLQPIPPVDVTAAEPVEPTTTKLGLPISHALDRVTKKHFGQEVHPETSPVENDHFDGFHVGVDFETTEDEQDIDVPIYAVCDGKLMTKNFAKGYGGFALQSCTLDGEEIQVTYGHLHLETIVPKDGGTVKRGDLIGMLGKGHSPETDGVRKHLHLGIHQGTATDIRGYVPDETEIGAWLDPLEYMK